MRARTSAALLLAVLAAWPLPSRAATEDPPAPVAEERQVRALGEGDLRRVDSALAVDPSRKDLRMDRLRILYVLAVKDRARKSEGEKFLAGIPAALGLPPGDALMQAYRGAFQVLGAKHDLWPPRKLEHLKAGLPALDSAVAARPDHAEIRYLRLVSSYYLPFFIGRKPEVKADFAALARLLPAAHADYPPRWYLGFAGFVMEKGGLAGPERAAVAEGMRRASARKEAE